MSFVNSRTELCHLKEANHEDYISALKFHVREVKAISEAILHFQPTIDLHCPDQDLINNGFCQNNTCGIMEQGPRPAA